MDLAHRDPPASQPAVSSAPAQTWEAWALQQRGTQTESGSASWIVVGLLVTLGLWAWLRRLTAGGRAWLPAWLARLTGSPGARSRAPVQVHFVTALDSTHRLALIEWRGEQLLLAISPNAAPVVLARAGVESRGESC